uniref:Uncharacterized protein n=1 Tax=mine drainage metagenome TaxID=410659 RepID=E6QL64_9ZZZZ
MLANAPSAALNNHAGHAPETTGSEKLSLSDRLSRAQWVYPAAVVFAIFLILIGF